MTSGAITICGSLLAACGGSSTTNSGVLPIGTPANPIKLPVTTDRLANGLGNKSETLEILNQADYQNPEWIAIFENSLVSRFRQAFTTVKKSRSPNCAPEDSNPTLFPA